MSKRVLFIEHDHVSAGGPIWRQFEKRGYEISRFIIVDEEHAKLPMSHQCGQIYFHLML